jgi:hypothetical protein
VDRGISGAFSGRVLDLLLIKDTQPKDDRAEQEQEKNGENKREFGQRLPSRFASRSAHQQLPLLPVTTLGFWKQAMVNIRVLWKMMRFGTPGTLRMVVNG